MPLVGFTPRPIFSLSSGGGQTAFSFPEDYVARSRRLKSETTIEASEVIFVGYGIVAPEYGWDDFKNVDVRGKTLIVLDNEPRIPDSHHPARLDEGMFKGKVATYYGTRPYKFEMAALKGADAVLVIHDPATAYAPFKVIQNNFQSEALDIKSTTTSLTPTPVEGWITLDAVRRLCCSVNRDFAHLRQAALAGLSNPCLSGLMPVSMLEALPRNRISNVVAKIEGSDSRLRDEYVIYTAHWDYLGARRKIKGRNNIYNGAIDNAGGVAQLLEIAEGFVKLKTPPKRSILFIATTAEEKAISARNITSPIRCIRARARSPTSISTLVMFGGGSAMSTILVTD